MPRPKKPILLPGQQALMRYYQPIECHPLDYWLDETIRINPNGYFQQMAVQFRQHFEATHTTWVYLGSQGDFCYYRTADFCEYRAYSPLFRGIEVGQVSIDDEYYLYNLNVNIEFRRRGIGTNLIIFANDTTRLKKGSRLLILMGNPGQHSRSYPPEYYLINEGLELIRSCRAKGILEHDQLIGTTPDPSPRHYSQSPSYMPRSPETISSPRKRSLRHHDGTSPLKRPDYHEY